MIGFSVEERRKLQEAFEKTGDDRFAAALSAIADHALSAKRGPEPDWGVFVYFVLYIIVRARVEAFGISETAALRFVAKHDLAPFAPSRRIAFGTLKPRFIEAKNLIMGDEELASEAKPEILAFAANLRSRRNNPANQ